MTELARIKRKIGCHSQHKIRDERIQWYAADFLLPSLGFMLDDISVTELEVDFIIGLKKQLRRAKNSS